MELSKAMSEKVNLDAMRKVFFRNNLFAFLALLFVPIVVMGSLSMYLLHGYIRKNLDKETQILLEQLVSKVATVTDQFNPLILTVDIDGQSSYVARKLLDSVEMSYTDIFLLNNIKDQLSSMRNAREYIHSINLYFTNDHGYYLSDTGKHSLTPKDDYWFDSYVSQKETQRSWTQTNEQSLAGGFSFKLLSIFHILGNGEGVIVFNLRISMLDSLLNAGLLAAGHQALVSGVDGSVLFGSAPEPETRQRYSVRTEVAKPSGWTLTLYSDKGVIFLVYRRVLTLIILLSLLSLVIGVVLSVWLTQRRTRQIYAVIHLLEAARDNESLPQIPKRQGPTYGYIIHQIINTFLQQSYLQTQLEARKYKLKTAQLMALQAQLNPHFLFNTLETLNWKVYEMTDKPNQVNQMIEHLSDLMRYSLSSIEDMVSLDEELQSIRSYLALQAIRYQDKFEAVYTIAPEALGFRMPRMLLQPIVENALYHGIKMKKEQGTITIEARVVADALALSISDDGVGMEKHVLESLTQSFSDPEQVRTDHIGLANVNARLFLLYGTTLSLCSEPTVGTVVTMTIHQKNKET